MSTWLGVDVGGVRKGFDVAIVSETRLLGLASGLRCDEVLGLVGEHVPQSVGIDSPRDCAPPGSRARACERELARRVCGIRWTPDAAEVTRNPYYGWVLEGLTLHHALAAAGVPALEVFPTASWTRWLGPRAGRSRAAWSSEGLRHLPLDGLPERCSQDVRDAIAAAFTARLHSLGEAEVIGGEIVVPLSPL